MCIKLAIIYLITKERRNVMKEKVNELRARTIRLLENSRKDIKKFANERKTLYKFFEDDYKADINEWEKYIKYFEEQISKSED